MKVTISILLSFLLLGWSHLVDAQPITLVTLGDSLTEGDGDDGIGGGYPARLITRLQTPHPGSVLHQLGISGDTTTDLINKQLTPAVNVLNSAPAGNLKIALIWIGSNDLFGFYNYTITQTWCSGMGIDACEAAEMANSAENVRTILETLQTTGASLYIALLDDQSRRPVITDPVLRAATFPNITDEYAARMSTQVSVYNGRIQVHAATYGAQTVDFYNTTIFEEWDTLSDDGNHPNGAGYDAITDIWYNAIINSPPPPTPQIIPITPTLHLLLSEQVILEEKFESWPPTGWTIRNNGGDCIWQSNIGSNYAGGEGKCAAADSSWCGPYTEMDTELRTPVLDLSRAGSATLSYVSSYDDSSTRDDYAEVDISTNGGTTWTNLLRWSGSDHDRYGPGEKVTLNLTPYVGSNRTVIRFHYNAPWWCFWWMIDNVFVSIK